MYIRKIDAAAFVVGAAIPAMLWYKIGKIHRAQRLEIDAQTNAELVLIGKATGVILERIRNGTYSGKTIEDLFTEMEFEQIAFRNGG